MVLRKGVIELVPKWLKFGPLSPSYAHVRLIRTHLLRTYSWLSDSPPPPHLISKSKSLDIQNHGEGLLGHSRDMKIITKNVVHEKSIILFKQNSIVLDQGVSNAFGPKIT